MLGVYLLIYKKWALVLVSERVRESAGGLQGKISACLRRRQASATLPTLLPASYILTWSWLTLQCSSHNLEGKANPRPNMTEWLNKWPTAAFSLGGQTQTLISLSHLISWVLLLADKAFLMDTMVVIFYSSCFSVLFKFIPTKYKRVRTIYVWNRGLRIQYIQIGECIPPKCHCRKTLNVINIHDIFNKENQVPNSMNTIIPTF